MRVGVIQQWQQPTSFLPCDNPASFEPMWSTRALTYTYLASYNLFLLAFPYFLCCDWSFGCMPIVSMKNVAQPEISLLLLSTIVIVLIAGLHALQLVYKVAKSAHKSSITSKPVTDLDTEKRCEQMQTITLGLLLLFIPFLPCSNVFFPVGFVLAERVLYIPSMGFCMLVPDLIQGFSSRCTHLKGGKQTSEKGFIFFPSICILLALYTMRCVQRDGDWRTAEDLFRSGLRVFPNHPKLLVSVGQE